MERLWRAMDEGAPPPPRAGAGYAPYLLGAALIVAGLCLRLLLGDLLSDGGVLLLFVPAVLMASGGGLWAGLATTAVSLAAALAPVGPPGIEPALSVSAIFFAVLGCAISYRGESLLRLQEHEVDATRQLAEREAHLQSILDTMPDAMLVIDARGQVQSFSAAAETLFGWSKAEVVGRNVSLLMPSPDREAHDSYMERYRRTGERRIIGMGREVLAQRKDGSTFPAELCVGEMTPNGRTFYTGFLRDLSERQEAEVRLQTLQSELVHISRLSAMGEMAATLAHELNQPLSAISIYLKGALRVLEGEGASSQAMAPVGKAAEQSLRAGQIIRRLRDFLARGESQRRVESLTRLVEEAAALALLGVRDRPISFTIERDMAADEVTVDRVQVQQVIVNLIRNAVDAMDGSPRQALDVRLDAADGDMVEVSIADTGPGVSPEIAEKLFQPFVTTKGDGGMGVGLSISRSIIEAHGGRIWMTPRAGGGAVFHFTLPLAGNQEADA